MRDKAQNEGIPLYRLQETNEDEGNRAGVSMVEAPKAAIGSISDSGVRKTLENLFRGIALGEYDNVRVRDDYKNGQPATVNIVFLGSQSLTLTKPLRPQGLGTFELSPFSTFCCTFYLP